MAASTTVLAARFEDGHGVYANATSSLAELTEAMRHSFSHFSLLRWAWSSKSVDVAFGGTTRLGLRRSPCMNGQDVLFYLDGIKHVGTIESVMADGAIDVSYGSNFAYDVIVCGSVDFVHGYYVVDKTEYARVPPTRLRLDEGELRRLPSGSVGFTFG